MFHSACNVLLEPFMLILAMERCRDLLGSSEAQNRLG